MVKVPRKPEPFHPPYYELDDLYRREDESSQTNGTAQATTSGTSIDFTGIPSWVKKITVALSGVSTNGSNNPIIQIGDSGGVETTGYVSSGTLTIGASSASTAFTAGFGIRSTAAGLTISGIVELVLLDASSNTWACSVNLGVGGTSTGTITGGGVKSLSATLDRVRLTTIGGTDTFDAGSINVIYG